MKQKKTKTTGLKPTIKSERVVVDELFDSGLARLLRAKRNTKYDPEDFSMDAWEKEQEDFIESWRIEAFAGFPSGRKLQEGDVFFIVDGSKLNNTYKPVPRESARLKHLLLPGERAREIARSEIKKEFYKLSAIQISSDKKRERNILLKRVEKNIEIESAERKQQTWVRIQKNS